MGTTLAPQGDPSNLEMLHLWKADKWIKIQPMETVKIQYPHGNGKRNYPQLGNVLSVEK